MNDLMKCIAEDIDIEIYLSTKKITDFKVPRRKQESYKFEIKPYVKFLLVEKKENLIVYTDALRSGASLQFDNLFNIFVDDLFDFNEDTAQSVITARIRIQEPKGYKINYLSWAATIKDTGNNISPFYRFSYSDTREINAVTKSVSNYQNYRQIPDTHHICVNDIEECLGDFYAKITLEYKDVDHNSIGTNLFDKNDIRFNYKFIIEIQDKEHKLEIRVKYMNKTIVETGKFTETQQNCNNICKNHASCTEENVKGMKNIKCICKDGYYGLTCEHKYSCGNCPFDKCNENIKCKSCPAGWKGDQCLEKICTDLEMCGAKGYCRDGRNARICGCVPGWTGDYCTRMFCDNMNYCQGRGTCKIENFKYTCECNPGWIGDTCNQVNCENINSCGQNGYCDTNSSSLHKCVCNKGWKGEDCNIIDCDDIKICKDDQRCDVVGRNRKCECDNGWSGYDCKSRVCIKKDDKYCGENGECTIIENQIACKCKAGFSGKQCEVVDCVGLNHCSKHGECLYDKNHIAYCECQNIWGGTKCEIPLCNEFVQCPPGKKCVINNHIRECQDMILNTIPKQIAAKMHMSEDAVISFGTTCIIIIGFLILAVFKTKKKR